MVWYVAIVAVLNLGLGYAMAKYLGLAKSASAADELLDAEGI